uniref:Transcription factor Adf-1 n=1 Tax=Zeugodacus cucurbitae TaxID=28588 RepID=A0A0A1XF32_ZEUCU
MRICVKAEDYNKPIIRWSKSVDRRLKMSLKEDKNLCASGESAPQLYDKGHPDYGQRMATDEAWQSIAQLMGKSMDECKNRWRNIRSAYARSIGVYKTKRGENSRRSYYLAEDLEFLKPHLPRDANTEILSGAGGYENIRMDNGIQFVKKLLDNMSQTQKSRFIAEILKTNDENSHRGERACFVDNEVIQQRMTRNVGTQTNNTSELGVSNPQQSLDAITIKNEPEISL